MTTSTIIYTKDAACLIATIPDGGDVEAAIRAQEEDAAVQFDRDNIATASGLTLTDEAPEDDARIAWSSGKEGFLMDEAGRSYLYAVSA